MRNLKIRKQRAGSRPQVHGTRKLASGGGKKKLVAYVTIVWILLLTIARLLTSERFPFWQQQQTPIRQHWIGVSPTKLDASLVSPLIWFWWLLELVCTDSLT